MQGPYKLLLANNKKSILLPTKNTYDSFDPLIQRLLSLSEEKIAQIHLQTQKLFAKRHRHLKQILLDYYQEFIQKYTPKRISIPIPQISTTRQQVIASYVLMEYTFQGAALANPSIIIHPQQAASSSDKLRVILSFRCIGEQHISSICFREAYINRACKITLLSDSRYAHTVSAKLQNATDYQLTFSKKTKLCERVLFPQTDDEVHGMEDVRWTRFEDGNYYGTYTAYDGQKGAPKIIKTSDFQNFTIRKLQGAACQNKDMALFPRKINNQYYMFSRQDGVGLHLMSSKDLYTWETYQKIYDPFEAWGLYKTGACSTPIATPQGWLLITHAVGPLRRYTISAALFDITNPQKPRACLSAPLINPRISERHGYVPNVVYTCGTLLHNNSLIIPYAFSDQGCKYYHTKLSDLVWQTSS
jgi:predicted GH43/DUF377 family glycosyl hydrolase